MSSSKNKKFYNAAAFPLLIAGIILLAINLFWPNWPTAVFGFCALIISFSLTHRTAKLNSRALNQELQHQIDLFEKEKRMRQDAETAESEQRHLAEALRKIGIALSATQDFDDLLERLLDQIQSVLPYDTANIMLVNGNKIDIVCTRGYQEHAPYNQQFRFDEIPSLQQMALTHQPLIIPKTQNHPLWVKPETSPHVRSWAGAPIIVHGELVAFLALNDSQPDIYKESDTARLEAFASQAAIAIQNTRLYEQIQQRFEEQATINKISQAATSTLKLPKTLEIIADQTTRLLGAEATSVVLRDNKAGDLWFAAASGDAAEFVLGKRLEAGQGIVGWVIENGATLVVDDVEKDNRHFPDFDEKSGFKAESIMCVPLTTKGKTIGAIEVINKGAGRFDDEDLRLLSLLAAPAASAIENAQLYEQSQLEIENRSRIEKALEAERALLTRRVQERTADLSSANAELARAARLKDEFLASISHELRTPLNAVLGISEALQDKVYGELNDKQISSLRSIEESGRHLLSLINDILDLSKVEAGKLDLEIRPCSLESICQSSLRLIRQNAYSKKLKVRANFDETVQTVHVDERRVKQILVNLLSNAVKFTPENGEIGLDIEGDLEKRQVHITVWDTGIGIAKEDMTRLFRPFVQLDSRLSREYAGTGLGLSLVYRMVELHGGSVSVESQTGKGSQFTVSFPWQGEGQDADPIEKAEMIAADAPRLLTFKRALIIEDSPTTTAQLIRFFSEMGIETNTAGQGYGAVEKAIVDQPDIIILDIFLPDISGWEVLRQLKAEPPTQNIPVLVASVVDELQIALELGAAAILEKPIGRHQLQNALRKMLVAKIEDQQNNVMADIQKLANFSSKSILLVEDNETNIQTIADYLLAKEYQVFITRSGDEVLQLAQQLKPGVILMDIQLPKRNGLDIIREFRQTEILKEIPIIAVTALAMPGDEAACLQAGANAYISKPILLKELVHLIDWYLANGVEAVKGVVE